VGVHHQRNQVENEIGILPNDVVCFTTQLFKQFPIETVVATHSLHHFFAKFLNEREREFFFLKKNLHDYREILETYEGRRPRFRISAKKVSEIDMKQTSGRCQQ
jgi:hypothetical protein